MVSAIVDNPREHGSRDERSTLVNRLTLIGLLIAAVVVAVVSATHSASLLADNSAFTSITKSSLVTSLQTFVTSIMDQLKLVGLTLAGLAGTFVAVMYASGHTQPHQHALRIGWGVLALVCIAGVIA